MPVDAFILVFTGCRTPPPGDTAGDGVEVDPAEVTLAGSCPMESDLGGFAVEAFEAYSVVSGQVSDGVVPISVLTELVVEGDCRLLQRENPFCDPPCEASETCSLDAVCVPYPLTQDLGTVRVDGLAEAVGMEPVSPGYTYFDTSLPHPGFEPGVAVVLQTGTGYWDPVLRYGVGVTPLVPVESSWVVSEGAALVVSWDAPTAPVRSEVVLQVSIDQHGASPTSVACTFADDGAGVVPASIVDRLLLGGVTGYPNGSLRRRTADSGPIEGGCMDFTVSSYRPVDVYVDGHTPCVTDGDCPDGQQCNEAIQTCG